MVVEPKYKKEKIVSWLLKLSTKNKNSFMVVEPKYKKEKIVSWLLNLSTKRKDM